MDLARAAGAIRALDEAQFALAGRALQIVDWDRSHQYCGACGRTTAARTSERSRECPAAGWSCIPGSRLR